MIDVDDDVVVEPDEEGDAHTSTQKLKKLRAERDQARKEAQEYLTGWQRTKADYVNLSKRARESGSDAANMGILAFARSIVPVFDSLEAAYKNAETGTESVQKGIEQVILQLEGALKEHGITRFVPERGDEFDPNKHEPMQTLATLEAAKDNRVADVFQSGYAKGDTVIRPARVAVNKFNN
jgi:molecular chaperone GrpE